MKEAIAWAFIAFVRLGLIWVALIAASLIFGRGRARPILFVLALVSIPALVYLEKLRGDARMEAHWKARTQTAREWSQKFKEVCARPEEFKIFQIVKSELPVDLRVHEPPQVLPVDVMRPLPLAKTICWSDASQPRCASPHIASVQWEYISRSLQCRGERETNEDCHIIWSQSVKTGSQEKVSNVTATYTLEIVSKRALGESGSAEPFDIYVIDDKTAKRLGQSTIYRKSLPEDVQWTEEEMALPRYCPDRDATIGKLLELVFPPP